MARRDIESQSGVFLVGVLRSTDRAALVWHAAAQQFSVEVLKEEVATQPSIEPERRHTSEGETYSMHFIGDDRRLVYLALTAKDYPMRVVFALLDEVRDAFVSRYEDQAGTAKDGSLNKAFRTYLKEICAKYADPANVDKILAVQAKVEVVRSTMQDSIATMLQNDERLEHIQGQTETLQRQAQMFQRQATQTRKYMQWKALRWQLLLVAFVALVIAIPIIVVSTRNAGHSHK